MSASALHRLILRAALSGSHAFVWVLAFQHLLEVSGSITASFAGVAVTYALAHTVTILATPLAARNMQYGSRRTLMSAVLSAAAAFLVLGGSHVVDQLPLISAMGAFAILMGLYRSLYYVPYSIAKDVGGVGGWEVLIALMPAVVGIVWASGFFVPQTIMFAAAGLCVASLVPARFMRNTHEAFSWRYRQTFHQLFSPEHRTLLALSIAQGLEAVALLLVWPIGVWMIVDGSYPMLGIVLSATLLFTMAARFFLRRFGIVPTPVVAIAMQASGWALRYVAGNAISVILIDTYAHAPNAAHRSGHDLATNEQAVDNHTYVDEFTALKEMGQAIGRILMCALVVLLALSASVSIVIAGCFAAAAAAGIATTLMLRDHRRTAF